jgi:hypothetical protein
MILINQIFNNFYDEKKEKNNIFLSDNDKFLYIFFLLIFFIIINKFNINTNFIYSLFIFSAIIYVIYIYELNNNDEKLFFLNTFLNNKSYLNTHKSFINFLYNIKDFDNNEIYTNLINNINLFLKHYDEIKINKKNYRIDIIKDISKNIFEIYNSFIFNISDELQEKYQINMNILFKLLNKHVDYIIINSNNNIDINNINNTSILDNKNDMFYIYD